MKDFLNWHLLKSNLDSRINRPFFHEQEIWWCSFGLNIGSEQDGHSPTYLRPVIILKKFNSRIFWGVPLTKKKKEGKYHYLFSITDKQPSTAILTQLRLLDSKRLKHKMGRITAEHYVVIKTKLKHLLE